jgi:hypothetical protein
MSVTIDHEALPVESLGLKTVGQVLAHVARDNRLVVNLLIDGAEPDLREMSRVRSAPLTNHTVFIETAEPREMADEVLTEVESQLSEADAASAEAVTLLQQNQTAQAMQKLSGCFTIWHHAQESIDKVAQLIRLDLDLVKVGAQTLADVLREFGDQLRQVRGSLENRDYVTLGDVLTYETPATLAKWRQAIGSIRRAVAPR